MNTLNKLPVLKAQPKLYQSMDLQGEQKIHPFIISFMLFE
jgi:hypothetical protein